MKEGGRVVARVFHGWERLSRLRLIARFEGSKQVLRRSRRSALYEDTSVLVSPG
ncbi:hypothetical protein [Oscillatoria acuminata]|uniref:hypothetical protein n=1 Tax=Oscillatoria acuminata TaxID=118323 RepID=UPI00030A5ADC|nr:hypothetical protein [Oscillatoria acuminata]